MNRLLDTYLRLLAVASLLMLALSVQASDVDSQLAEARAKVSAMFEFIEPEHVNLSPIDGWFTIHKGSVVAYISSDGRYLLQGDLIDLELQVNLSEQSRTDARRRLVSSLEDEDSILFSPAEVKHSVTVFTDVDCTYCRKLHAEIDEYLDRGIAIRYVLYPRNGPASRAWSTSEDVVCARDRGAALTAAKLGKEFESQRCDASMLTRHYSLGQDIGLNGTPAIIFDDGTMIAGYLAPAALSMRLEMASRSE
ncbi:MAG: DsbC family protein [Gammaproteobacteria bacterium]|nr:DsbC family protein [Gammaproteobacteria bacterium]